MNLNIKKTNYFKMKKKKEKLNLKLKLSYLKDKLKKIKHDFQLKQDNKINNKSQSLPKPIKIRNPGVDLGRILAMLGIIIHHIIYHGKAMNKYPKYKVIDNINSGVFWHVSTYIFISGYVGYKTTKYSNLLYLWLCTLFYSLGIIKYLTIYKPHLYKKKIELMDFFPVLTNQYWYFTAHFGMYLFLPLYNKGLEHINKSQLKVMIISLIGVYIVLKDYMIPNSDIFKMNGGYSSIWFLIFYSTGAYFGKFKKERNIIQKIIYNIIYILIFYFSAKLCFDLPSYQINERNPKFKDKFIIFLKRLFITRISAVPMILESIAIMLFITNITYNKYIAKIISFIGPLTFGIYLIHDNIIIRKKIMRNILNDCPKQLPCDKIIKIILKKALKIFAKCAIIEYLRNILFRICQIRRICILIEKFIFIILG